MINGNTCNRAAIRCPVLWWAGPRAAGVNP
jgi:hypothetical protein